jgi:hypothetical protein
MSNNDMSSKAKWVADMMKADGVTPEMITQDLIMAYFDAIGKKIESIQNAVMTRPEARAALEKAVLATCR